MTHKIVSIRAFVDEELKLSYRNESEAESQKKLQNSWSRLNVVRAARNTIVGRVFITSAP